MPNSEKSRFLHAGFYCTISSSAFFFGTKGVPQIKLSRIWLLVLRIWKRWTSHRNIIPNDRHQSLLSIVHSNPLLLWNKNNNNRKSHNAYIFHRKMWPSISRIKDGL